MTALTNLVTEYHTNEFNSRTGHLKRIVRAMRMGAPVMINGEEHIVLDKVYRRAKVMGTDEIRILGLFEVDSLFDLLDQNMSDQEAQETADGLFGYGVNTNTNSDKRHVDWPSLINVARNKIISLYKYETVEVKRLWVESGEVFEAKYVDEGETLRVNVDHSRVCTIESPELEDEGENIRTVRLVLNGKLEDTGEKVIIDAIEITSWGDCRGEEIAVVGKKVRAA